MVKTNADLYGPVYSQAAVVKLLSLGEAEVADLVRTGSLLALPVEDTHLFPVFQFEGHEIRQEVIEVARTLSKASDVFSAAQWLHARLASVPNADLLRAHELLKTDPDTVRQAALETAARWSA